MEEAAMPKRLDRSCVSWIKMNSEREEYMTMLKFSQLLQKRLVRYIELYAGGNSFHFFEDQAERHS